MMTASRTVEVEELEVDVLVEDDVDDDVDVELDVEDVVAVVLEDADEVEVVVAVENVVLEEEVVDVPVLVLVLVVVDDVVVDTDVVALDVTVEVCVVDGDVISQPWNVPASCIATSSFRAAANSVRKDSPVASVSSSTSTSKMM